MEFKTFVFYVLAAILVFAALRTITARNPVHAALFLVLSFFSTAALWMLLQAEFLAIILIMVYVGAVMVLFLFVVMMLDIDIARLRHRFWSSKWVLIGGGIAVLMVFEMALVLGAKYYSVEALPGQTLPEGYSNTKELGRLLYTEYVYPFELASVILLVGVVAAVMLTLRQRKDTKYQKPAEQLAVKRDDRVRLVKMAAEKDEPAAPPEQGGQ